MKVLVTGAGGFAGYYTIKELEQSGHDVIAMDMSFKSGMLPDSIKKAEGSILDKKFIYDSIAEHMPDSCIHLAGIAFVPVGTDSPGLVYEVNISGTINILNAFKDIRPDGRVLTVSSANVYEATPYNGVPLKEDSPLAAISPYGLSKIAADRATEAWYHKYGLETISVRPGNHTGPYQSPAFVVPDFAKQLINIKKGKHPPLMRVGNLQSRRSFSDVRDIVHAYRLLLENGNAGEQYNVTTNNLVSIQSILDQLMEETGVRTELQIDTKKFRPTDSAPLMDTSKIERDVNWHPKIELSTTLKDIIASYL